MAQAADSALSPLTCGSEERENPVKSTVCHTALPVAVPLLNLWQVRRHKTMRSRKVNLLMISTRIS